jgi:hypothetical protein
MKPGDLIEWVYKSNYKSVRENDEFWSTPMQRWVPIGVQPMMLISITDEFYMWLTPTGLFRARVDDAQFGPTRTTSLPVVLRSYG